jgi:hypothetical protein
MEMGQAAAVLVAVLLVASVHGAPEAITALYQAVCLMPQ